VGASGGEKARRLWLLVEGKGREVLWLLPVLKDRSKKTNKQARRATPRCVEAAGARGMRRRRAGETQEETRHPVVSR